MNHLQSEILPERSLFQSHPARPGLPAGWIEKLFERLFMMYGNKFSKMWESVDLAEMKMLWSEKLAKYADHPECFRWALEECEDNPWPPSLSEFMILCKKCLESKPKLCCKPGCGYLACGMVAGRWHCGNHFEYARGVNHETM